MIWICKFKLKGNNRVWIGQTEWIADKEDYFKREYGRIVTFQPVSTDLSLKMYHFTLETASHETQSGRRSGMKDAHMHRIHTHVYKGTHTHNHTCLITFMVIVRSKGPFYAHCVVLRPWVIVSGNVICQNILWHCRSTSWAPGMRLRGRTHLCIKAINKIIGLVILFQTSRLLAHPAAVKDSFLAVTGVRWLLRTL